MNNRLRNKLWFLIFILIPLMLILGACTEKSDVTAKKDTNSSDKKDVEASHACLTCT